MKQKLKYLNEGNEVFINNYAENTVNSFLFKRPDVF